MSRLKYTYKKNTTHHKPHRHIYRNYLNNDLIEIARKI